MTLDITDFSITDFFPSTAKNFSNFNENFPKHAAITKYVNFLYRIN